MLYLKILLNCLKLNNSKFISLHNINMHEDLVEHYNKNTNKKAHKKNKFPVWVLFLVIGLILAIGLFFSYKINEPPTKVQNFGFRFY